MLELTHNYGVDKVHELGNGFRARRDRGGGSAATCDAVRALTGRFGGRITREPGPVKGGKTVIAFIEDPDGYKIELIEAGSRA